MSLRQQQSEFARKVALLILFAYEQGYEISLGDAYRDPRCGYGHPQSFHGKKLAIDLNLFKDGKYLTASKHHEPLGLFWESLGGTWGGRFGDSEKNKDGNHYSWGETRRIA